MSDRVHRVKHHLCSHFTSATTETTDSKSASDSLPPPSWKEKRDELLDSVENAVDTDSRQRLIKGLACGLGEGHSMHEELYKMSDEANDGQLHTYFQTLSRKYGSDTSTGHANTAIPLLFQPIKEPPVIDVLVIVGNPDDVQRIANNHVKKAKVYALPFLGNGVLSNRDNDLWIEQRKHLSDAFLPQSILQRVFPVSLARAKHAVTKILPSLITESNSQGVEINEFLLYEAMAQLQLALLGDSEENMNACNKELRDSYKIFTQTEKVAQEKLNTKASVFEMEYADLYRIRSTGRKFIHKYSEEMLQKGEAQRQQKSEAGPLMERMLDLCPFGKDMPKIRRDTCSTFLFAGHDTTGNLMTHVIYEMAVNPNWQRKLQAEVDMIFDTALAEKREMHYTDLQRMIVMKRCINETLRMWPSVPIGTFREIEVEDHIMGKNNQPVKLEPGMQVVLPVYLLHRNKALWGDDVDVFNPDREWLPEEDWDGKGLSGMNPQSHRFCPFTYGPRDCMGKNFAQMEARVILASIFRRYNVTLGEKTKGKSLYDISSNKGTLGPVNGLYVNLEERNLAL